MADITSNLLLHLPLDEQAGVTAANMGSLGDATLQNMTFDANSEAGVPSIAPARGLRRKVAGDHINCGNMTGFTEGDGTLSVWMKTSETSGNGYAFSDAVGSEGTLALLLSPLSATTMRVRSLFKTTNQSTVDVAFVAGVPQLYGVTYDFAAGRVRTYINGALIVDNALIGGGIWNNTNAMLMFQRPGADFGLDAMYDDARIYDRALSDEDHLALYNYPGIVESTGTLGETTKETIQETIRETVI